MAKSISGAVGRGGRNFPQSDVMTVQYLLNCVPASQGGPSPELVVDGAVGPKTIAAIEKFQRSLGGFADGRVDPGGGTLRALQGRDPYPGQPLPAQSVKTGGWPPNQKGGQFPVGGAKGPGNNPFGQKCGQYPAGGTKGPGSNPFGQKCGQFPPGGAKGGPSFPGGGKTAGSDPFGQKCGQFPAPGMPPGAWPGGKSGGGGKGF